MPEFAHAEAMPAEWGTARFEVARIESAGDLPEPSAGTIDVAVLDMNAGYPNVGHDAIVALLRDFALARDRDLAARGRRVRVLSYAVRDRLMVPDHASGRHRLYVGTGGPGHPDPRQNRAARGTEEIVEDPSWEAPLWRLFDAIHADESAALYGVCHTFEVLCRWSGMAEPVRRDGSKNGAKSGIGDDVLTPEGRAHPWFAPLAATLGDGMLPVLESRYYDLIPVSAAPPNGMTAIARESNGSAEPGEAVTMLEVAREPGGVAPRVFAVNNHPELGTAARVQGLLERLLARGAITPEVFAARSALLPALRDDRSEARLRVARFAFSGLIERKLDALVRAA